MNRIIGPERILRQLHQYNPWWTGREKGVPAFRRVAFGRCWRLLNDLSHSRAVVLTGPRRVGKSTILHQIAHRLVQEGHRPQSVVYISLDDNILKLAPLDEILSVYRQNILPEPERAILLLDEVHYAAQWEQHLKTLIDHQPEYRILATGSASLHQNRGGADAGVGRWRTVVAPTLSFYEFLQIRQETPAAVDGQLRPGHLFHNDPGQLASIAAAFRSVMPRFARYLLVGGFPETAARVDDVTECQRLLREDIVDRVLKRDMTALFGVRAVADLERLFIYLCLHTGAMLNINRCAKELGVNRQTVLNHLDLLVQANLVYRVDLFAPEGKKVLKAQSKYYLVDAALRNAVLLNGEEILQDPKEMGVIVETAVLRHLYAFHYRDTPRIAYWRGPDRMREVDIIIHSPKYTVPVEVKYRSDARVSAADELPVFCRANGIDRGYFITRQDSDFAVRRFFNDDVAVLEVPAHIFTYLLGQAESLDAHG